MQLVAAPLAAHVADDACCRRSGLPGHAHDAECGAHGNGAAVEVADAALDQKCLPGVREDAGQRAESTWIVLRSSQGWFRCLITCRTCTPGQGRESNASNGG
jgi:hypothetical protein